MNQIADSRPCFEVHKVRIRGLKSIERLDLPDSGFGWNGVFPKVALIGGVNGSGKTTLLSCIAGAARAIAGEVSNIQDEVKAQECLIDFAITDGNSQEVPIRFLVGDEDFVHRNGSDQSFGYTLKNGRADPIRQGGRILHQGRYVSFLERGWPRLVFVPSEDRDLTVPHAKPRLEETEDDGAFVKTWRKPGAREWKGVVAWLHHARWIDLNAKENGRIDDAGNFEGLTRAFRELTSDGKRLVWTAEGKLMVELRSGAIHRLDELSSGERQMLLHLALLRNWWRPGSLILIDEPELHLHQAWQTLFYEALVGMQKELGGQVILATQSHHLFEIGDSDTKALLGGQGLQ